MARDYTKIMGRWGVREIRRSGRQKTGVKMQTWNTYTISRYDSIPRRFENHARINY
jgi:hypothetical protein